MPIIASANPYFNAGISYLYRGWPAIPLRPRSKQPLGRWKQFQQRLPTVAELEQWWAQDPDANVGVVMGPVSGLVGLDIDGQPGEDLLAALGVPLPETLAFETPGGGRRLLFRWPDHLAVRIQSIPQNGKEALKILSAGSQTVMPPSLHPNGREYEWLYGCRPGEIQAAEFAAALLDALGRHRDPQEDDQGSLMPAISSAACGAANGRLSAEERASLYLAKCDPAISGRGGHNQTFKVATKLVKGFALSQARALRLLLDHYNQRCQPPWSEPDLRHKVSDAAKLPGQNGYLLQVPVKKGGSPR